MKRNSIVLPARPVSVLDRWKVDRRQMGRDMAIQIKEEYQKQVDEITSDNWLRILAVAGLSFYEATGSRSRTEKLLTRFAERLEVAKIGGVATNELVDELSRLTDIELEVRG